MTLGAVSNSQLSGNNKVSYNHNSLLKIGSFLNTRDRSSLREASKDIAKALPMESHLKLAYKNDPNERKKLASKAYLYLMPEKAIALSNDSNEEVRISLAKNKNLHKLPRSVIVTLSNDTNDTVQYCLSKNLKSNQFTIDDIQELIPQVGSDLRQRIEWSLSLIPGILSGGELDLSIAHDKNIDTFPAYVIRTLIMTQNDEFREAMVSNKRFLMMHYSSRDHIVDTLLNDPSDRVVARLVTNQRRHFMPRNIMTNMLQRLINSNDHEIRAYTANRANLSLVSTDLVKSLLNDPHPEVRERLGRNPSIRRFSQELKTEIIESILSEFPDSSVLMNTLMPDVPDWQW